MFISCKKVLRSKIPSGDFFVFVSAIERVFGMADIDSDGRVRTGELSSLLRANLAGYVNMPLVERDIVAADRNQDGTITLTGKEAS